MFPSSPSLSKSHLFQVYACENEEIIKSGSHPISYVEMHYMRNGYNPRRVAVLCYLKDFDERFTGDNEERLRNEVERGIAVCKDCMCHEPRKNQLHPKSEVERLKELTRSMKIIPRSR